MTLIDTYPSHDNVLPHPASSCLIRAESLRGVSLLVAAGDYDEIAPVSAAESLLAACVAAGVGSAAEPIFRFSGDHTVTPEVADRVAAFLRQLLHVEVD